MNSENLEATIPENQVITLTDQFGEEVDFLFLDILDKDDVTYLILAPAEEDEDDTTEVMILKVEDNNEDEGQSYSTIEDEIELHEVFTIFRHRHKDEYDFVDEYGQDI